MSRAAPRTGQGGLTLLEVMIAIAILAFMMAMAWATISGTATAKRNTEASQARNRELRVATGRIVRDLNHAYLSANEDQTQIERRTLFVGKSSGEVDELRFSTMAHAALWGDADESEQTLVAYYAETDPTDASVTNLVRRESRRLSNEPWKSEPAEIDLLIPDIEEVHFEYWDYRDKSWKTSWDTTGSDSQRGRLPTRVRVTVQIKRGDDPVKYTTQAKPLMQEQLQFFTN
jgi:general secretion pathway protein J